MISVILYMYSLSLFFLTCARNTSSFETGNLIYIRPSALKVLVQPSDGEVGRELTVQPQLVFLDKQVPCAQVTILTWSWVVCCILCMFQIPPPSSRYMCPGCQPTLWHLPHLEHQSTFIIFLLFHSLLSFHLLWTSRIWSCRNAILILFSSPSKFLKQVSFIFSKSSLLKVLYLYLKK